MNKHVVVSGFFNPITVGHIDLFRSAKYLTHAPSNVMLTAIVNNDEQVRLKGSIEFYNEFDRMKLVRAIRWIDRVILSIDSEYNICNTIRRIHTQTPIDIFYNGGDVCEANNREAKLCEELGIKCVYGGAEHPKIASSSEAIRKAAFQLYQKESVHSLTNFLKEWKI